MNSLELYKAASREKSYTRIRDNASIEKSCLHIITTMFCELITTRKSPLLSKFCSEHKIRLDVKNFKIDDTAGFWSKDTSAYDMFFFLLGINAVFFNELDGFGKTYAKYLPNFFSKVSLPEGNFEDLKTNLARLDENIGRFFDANAPKVAPSTKTVTETKILPAAYDPEFTVELNQLAANRKNADENLTAEIKNLQVSLQAELKNIQDSLQEISDIRNNIEFQMMKEPIEQLLDLIDKLNATLKQHPNETDGKGYGQLIKRCNSFSRFLLQTLAALGAEIINTEGVTINPAEHEFFTQATPQSKVAKITRIGCKYKGAVIRKAEVEIEAPVAVNPNQLRS